MRRTLLALALVVSCGCSSMPLVKARIGFVAATAADLGTSAIGFNQGATEANPVLKVNPILASAVLSAILAGMAEIAAKFGDERTASVLYQMGMWMHSGAAVWNGTQLLK